MGTDNQQEKDEKIDSRLKSIEEKIDQILPEVENVLAQRVYKAAKQKLSSSARLLSFFLAILIGAVGYQSYKEIIDIGGTKVAEILAESVIPELQKDVQAQVDTRLKELMVEARAQANVKLDQKIAEVSAIYQEKFNSLLKEIKKSGAGRIDVSKSIPKVEGYVLYGEGKKDNSGTWIWSKQNFNVTNGNQDTFPEINKIVITNRAVLVRDQAPSVEYENKEISIKVPVIKNLMVTFQDKVISSTKTPVLDDTLSKAIGTIQREKKVKIKSVQVVLGKYVWVNIQEL
jgi:hypothetical protein